MLSSREIENIFENSDFIYMLSQAAGDRQILARQLGISPTQLSYVTHSNAGEGLLFYGNTIIPFVDHFPKDKERQEVDASKEGRFQAGLLAPLRSFRDIVEHMEQSAGKAVGQLEKLEQAAARKPSVLDNLKKAEKPEKAAPAPKRAEPEAAL